MAQRVAVRVTFNHKVIAWIIWWEGTCLQICQCLLLSGKSLQIPANELNFSAIHCFAVGDSTWLVVSWLYSVFFPYMNVLLLSISIVLIQLNRHPGRTISVKEFQNIRFRSMTLYLHLYVNFRVYSWKQTCYFSQFIPVNHHGVIIASNWPHSIADWSQTDSTLTL